MHPFNILIVDDNPKNIQVLGSMLRESGFTVGFATDGQKALNILQNVGNYDLVLLDIDMPVMNGFDTCIEMRKDENLKSIPVIFLTAFTDTENKIRGFEVGAQDYVTKPFNAQELLSRVGTQLELKAKSDEIKQINFNLEQLVTVRTIELEKVMQKLSLLDSMKTGFLIMISQEIRNPLNGIVGALNLIKNHEFSSTIKNLVETLNSSVVILEDFTSNAMLSTQLSSETYTSQITDIDLKELIQFVLISLDEDLHKKNIEIDLGNFPQSYSIKGDRELIYKSFTSVLHNAINQSPQNGVIDIAAKLSGMRVIVSITDFSSGFTPETLEGVMSPFALQNENLSYRTVLSLFLVKQILEYHHGKMAIFNKEHAGGCIEMHFYVNN